MPLSYSARTWNWQRRDKNWFIAELKKNPRTNRVFELFLLKEVAKNPLHLREIAARQSADAILLNNGDADVYQSVNAKALSYLAIPHMLFVTGNNISSDFSHPDHSLGCEKTHHSPRN